MLSGIINRLTEYFKLKAEQIKLEVMARVSSFLSKILVFAFAAFLGLFVTFFLSFAFSAYLNELLDSQWAGYLIMAGIYFLIMVIVLILAKTGKIQGWIESAFLEMNENDEEDE